MIGAGAAVAIVPATIQAIAARMFSTDEQAMIALALGFGVLVSAVVAAMSLESRLADPDIEVKTYIPYWALAAGVSGGLILIAMPGSALATALALPLIMTGLQIGRTHAIAAHRWRTETAAASILALGSGLAFWLSVMGSQWSMVTLGVSIVLTQCARSVGTVHRVRERVSLSRALWVGAETAVVASAPLLVNIIVLAAISAADAVAFRLILTVLGILQPLLGYLRTRLLLRSSPTLTVSLTTMTLLALAAVLIADRLGLFDLIFSQAWSAVPFAALLAACVWKAASVPGNIPFASMRRRGSVRQVFFMRMLSTAVYLSTALIAALTTQSLTTIFIAFILAELVTFAIYTFADRRTAQ